MVIGMGVPYLLRLCGSKIMEWAKRCCLHNISDFVKVQGVNDAGYLEVDEATKEKASKYDPNKMHIDRVTRDMPWLEAREALAFGPCEAVFVAGLRLVLWHWMQPLVYGWVLYSYSDMIKEAQLALAIVVAVREGLYFLLALYGACVLPQYLLLNIFAAPKENLGSHNPIWVVVPSFVLMPEKALLFMLTRLDYKHTYLTAATGLFFCFDMCAVAALVVGCVDNDLPPALGVSYGVTVAAGLGPVVMAILKFNDIDSFKNSSVMRDGG